MNTPLVLNDNNLGFITGTLGKIITFNFSHDKSANEIMKKWNKRVKRFNFKDYLVKMVLNDDNDLKLFEKINTTNKIGFYHKKTNVENVICLEEWYNINIRFNNAWYFAGFAHSTVRSNANFGRYYDVFKLLNGESDFIRNITYK